MSGQTITLVEDWRLLDFLGKMGAGGAFLNRSGGSCLVVLVAEANSSSNSSSAWLSVGLGFPFSCLDVERVMARSMAPMAAPDPKLALRMLDLEDLRVMAGWRARPAGPRVSLSGQVGWKAAVECAYRRGGSAEGAWGPAESYVLSGKSRMLSSSTLVSDDWLLCRDDASLSRESTDDEVEVELFLRCLDVCGVSLMVFVLTERGLRGETIESRIMKWVVQDGGDTSKDSTISAEADLTWKLPGCPGVAMVGRESSLARLGMTTWIWGLEPLPARRPYFKDERLLWRHCIRPFL